MAIMRNIVLGLVLLLATAIMPFSAYAGSMAKADEPPCQMVMAEEHDIAGDLCSQGQCDQCTDCTACGHCAAVALLTDNSHYSSPSMESDYPRFSVFLHSLYPQVDSPPPRLG